MSQSGPEKKTANSLIALSSAAVLAVYTAGFVRTKAAAEHLEALEARVRPAVSAAPAALPAATVAGPAPTRAAEVAKVDAAKVDTVKAPAPAAARAAATETPVAAEVIAEAPAPAAVPSPVEPTTPAPVVALAPPPAPVAPVPPQPTWKDGSYLGWGSARHGSIQASVEVAGGHIAVAKIEQCQMRYSCSMIDSLVPQVAQRGNPEKIDYISGATESSNVFYWALIDALSKAK